MLSTNDSSCAHTHVHTRSFTHTTLTPPLTSHLPQRNPGEDYLELPASSSNAASAPMTAEEEAKAEKEYQAIEAKFRAEFEDLSS